MTNTQPAQPQIVRASTYNIEATQHADNSLPPTSISVKVIARAVSMFRVVISFKVYLVTPFAL